MTSSSGTSLLPAKSEPGLAMPQVSAKGEEEAVVAACRLEKNSTSLHAVTNTARSLPSNAPDLSTTASKLYSLIVISCCLFAVRFFLAAMPEMMAVYDAEAGDV